MSCYFVAGVRSVSETESLWFKMLLNTWKLHKERFQNTANEPEVFHLEGLWCHSFSEQRRRELRLWKGRRREAHGVGGSGKCWQMETLRVEMNQSTVRYLISGLSADVRCLYLFWIVCHRLLTTSLWPRPLCLKPCKAPVWLIAPFAQPAERVEITGCLKKSYFRLNPQPSSLGLLL